MISWLIYKSGGIFLIISSIQEFRLNRITSAHLLIHFTKIKKPKSYFRLNIPHITSIYPWWTIHSQTVCPSTFQSSMIHNSTFPLSIACNLALTKPAERLSLTCNLTLKKPTERLSLDRQIHARSGPIRLTLQCSAYISGSILHALNLQFSISFMRSEF